MSGQLRVTRSVLIQSFKDDFDLPEGCGPYPRISETKSEFHLECDNCDCMDLANNQIIGGSIKHEKGSWSFLCDLKEQDILHVIWVPGEKMSSVMLTKNLYRPLFEKHISSIVSG